MTCGSADKSPMTSTGPCSTCSITKSACCARMARNKRDVAKTRSVTHTTHLCEGKRLRLSASRSQGLLPQGPLAREAMRVEHCGDFGVRRFVHSVARIAGEFGSHHARQLPARPRTGGALCAPRLIHPVGVVLKMNARVSNEHAVGRMADDPPHRAIRQGPRLQSRLSSIQVRAKRAIEAQQRAGSQLPLPQGLAVLEARLIKLGAAIAVAKGVQRAPIHTRAV